MSGDYVRNNPDPFVSARTMHNSYRIGMLVTISERLRKLKENTQPNKNLNACGISGMELMVVKDKAIEQRVDKLFPKLKRVSTRFSAVDGISLKQGIADGKNVSLHKSIRGSHPPAVIGM